MLTSEPRQGLPHLGVVGGADQIGEMVEVPDSRQMGRRDDSP